MNTGKRVWRDLYPNSMNWGSVLTTGGGLLFAGGTNDRMFRAYDAKSGEELWHFRPTPASSRRRQPSKSMACNMSQWSPVTASTRRSSRP